jgi:hypothetical protein
MADDDVVLVSDSLSGVLNGTGVSTSAVALKEFTCFGRLPLELKRSV